LGSSKVKRGSSYWPTEVEYLRSSYRASESPVVSDAFAGVRCAREVPSTP
jgi:formylglycine-generating enzyme required for sulfatase activity